MKRGPLELKRGGVLEGAARVLDLGGVYGRAKSRKIVSGTDASALRGDSIAVGRDMQKSANQVAAHEPALRATQK